MIPNYMDLPDSIKKYVPGFEYMLSDLGFSDNDENLKEEHSMVIKTLNKARYVSKEEVLDIFTEVVMVYTKRKDRDMIEHYLIETVVYLLSSRDDINEEELYDIAGQISEEGGELVMSAAEELIERGVEKGEMKGVRKSIISSLFNRFSMTDIKVNNKLDEINDPLLLDNLFNLKCLVKQVI